MSDNPISFLLCGQTDSGKSTISGHLLCLVHYFEQRIIDQTRVSNAKNKYSTLLDTDDVELELASKDKTKTAAFINFDFEFNDKKFRLIDTPGHKIYIRSMIEGLFHSQLRAICLVVSAIEDEFYAGIRGTTLEDMLLARASGCKNLIILWNKTDVAKPTKTMQELILYEAKMMSWARVQELYVSGYSGEGLFDILDLVEKMPDEKHIELKPLPLAQTFNCKVIFKTDQLITAGFTAVMHYAQHANRKWSSEVKRSADREEQTEAQHIEHASRKAQHVEGSEIEFEIEKIKGARMIRDTKPYDLVIKTAQPIQLHSKQRIIMRTGSETIGFGAIL